MSLSDAKLRTLKSESNPRKVADRDGSSTLLNEREFNRDWIEMQLAHCEGDVRSIYNAAEWLSGRREMMNWWSAHLEKIALVKRGLAALAVV